MQFSTIFSILINFTAKSSMIKISDYFIQNHYMSITNGLYLDFLTNTTQSQEIKYLVRNLSTKISSILNGLSLNKNSVVNELLKRDFGIKRIEVSAVYRKRILMTSSVHRLCKINGIKLNKHDFTSKDTIRNFYISNNIIDALDFKQINIPQNIDKYEIKDLIMSIEIACIHIDVFLNGKLSSAEIYKSERLQGKAYREENVKQYLLEASDRPYNSLKFEFNLLLFPTSNCSVKIVASQHGVRKTQIKLSVDRLSLSKDNWYIYIIGEHLMEKQMAKFHNSDDFSQLLILIGQKFVCEHDLSEFLLSLIHFYAEVFKKDILYRIDFITHTTVQIEVIRLINLPANELIKLYRNRSIPRNIQVCKNFHSILDLSKSYTLARSKDTEDFPIKTNVLLLRCGHVLGLELLTEWISNDYNNDDCYFCRQSAEYISSFEIDVYRVK